MLTMPWQLFPAAAGTGVLLCAALSQALTNRVPNVLTLPAILGGWLFAAYVDATTRASGSGHALLASFLGTVLALLIMLPIYRAYGMGAGCVKAQMAFAAWTCGAIPLVPALVFIASATLGGLAVTFAWLHLAAADIPAESRPSYTFPAQVTMTVVAVGGVIACWMISNPASHF